MRIWSTASHLGNTGLKNLISLFLSQRCPACDRATSALFCTDCQRQLNSTYYPAKGWQLQPTETVPVGALGEYKGLLKQAIRTLKYENRPDVAKALGYALAQRWLNSSAATQPNLYAVPIPLHANRLAQRGYNQAALIAQAFCQASGLPLLTHGLVRVQDTLPQHQLGLAARQQNLQQAFRIGDALQRLQHPARARRTHCAPCILLVDDIYTTGATTRSAVSVLQKAGLQVTGMLSLARAVND